MTATQPEELNMTTLTDEQKHAIDHAQKILRGVKLYGHAELLSASKPAAKSCQTGWGDICHMAKHDGITCPDDSCDIDDGIRAAPAQSAESIYQTCFLQGQWRDVDKAEYERARGLRDDLARIVYAAPQPSPTAVVLDDERAALRIMRQAFRVTEIEGNPDPDKQRFHMRFTFRSMEELHAADDQWRAFVAQPVEQTELHICGECDRQFKTGESAQPVEQTAQSSDTGNAEADRIIGRLSSSDPEFDDCVDAVSFIRKLVAEHKGPDGFETWKDAAIAERMCRKTDSEALRGLFLEALDFGIGFGPRLSEVGEWKETRVSKANGLVIRAQHFGAAQPVTQTAFDIALDALAEYQHNWDTGLPAEYAQTERIAMECAVEAVREALNEARDAQPVEQTAQSAEPVASLEKIAAIMGRDNNTDSPNPVAYLSTDPNKWDQCRIKPQGSFTVPVYTRATESKEPGRSCDPSDICAGCRCRYNTYAASPQPSVCATCNGHGMIGGPSYYAPDEGGEPCPDCAVAQPVEQTRALTMDEYHEDYGNVVWWTWEDGEWLGEPAWIGTPNDSDWPGYHTHWTRHPEFPTAARPASGETE